VSRIFGPIRQLGYVTRDIRTSLRHWIETAGVGPWLFCDQYGLLEIRYGGGTYTDFRASFAWANSGDLQIELIQQHSDTPTMIRDFLAEHPDMPPEGLVQHWAAWPDDYDAAYRRAVDAGLELGHHGAAPNNRFAYFRYSPSSATGIEIAEVTDRSRAFRETIRQAAIGWDGRDPIRPI
jgi:glyoxalase/bleomycin resistance protein/dioxygenase superfamily protein